MRILVCGGRDYLDYEVISNKLADVYDDLLKKGPVSLTVIQGGAKGADFLSKVWVFDMDKYVDTVRTEEYPADWKKYGKKAGAIRNQQMIDEGKPDLVLAFPGGVGTADMISRAMKAGIKVEVVNI